MVRFEKPYPLLLSQPFICNTAPPHFLKTNKLGISQSMSIPVKMYSKIHFFPPTSDGRPVILNSLIQHTTRFTHIDHTISHLAQNAVDNISRSTPCSPVVGTGCFPSYAPYLFLLSVNDLTYRTIFSTDPSLSLLLLTYPSHLSCLFVNQDISQVRTPCIRDNKVAGTGGGGGRGAAAPPT